MKSWNVQITIVIKAKETIPQHEIKTTVLSYLQKISRRIRRPVQFEWISIGPEVFETFKIKHLLHPI